jgi:hypothetical protein
VSVRVSREVCKKRHSTSKKKAVTRGAVMSPRPSLPPFGQPQVSARCADKGCGLPWTRFKGLLLTPGSKAQEQPDA